jgi:PAS domain S-box-containing protein
LWLTWDLPLRFRDFPAIFCIQESQAVKEKNNHAFAPAWPLMVALAAALILVATINVLWLRLDQKATEQADWVDHAHQVIALLEEALAKSDDMLTGQRGFALTREKDFLQPYLAATNRMPELIRSLREMVRDNPGQERRLDRLEELIARHAEINRAHIEALVKNDPLTADLPFRRAVKESLEAIHAVVGEMMAEENRLLAERREALRHSSYLVTLANIASGLVSMGLLLGVFGALWLENARRRGVEAELQRSHEKLEELVRQRTTSLYLSEERLRLAQQAARIGSFEWNIQTGVNIWTPELEAMHGLAAGGFPGTQPGWENLIHPDDRADAAARVQQALETDAPIEGEWRVIWPDKSVHWLFGRFKVFRDESDRPLILTGVNMDVTERKRLEREILEASDSEMSRIGHDLHDGVGQQLTALALFNAGLQRELQAQAPELAGSLKKIGSDLREIIRQVRVLSHAFSPVPFEDNGLVEALKQLADGTRDAAKVDCEFEASTPVPINDPHLAAQLYRIVQEAVTNALKHGQARKIIIGLESTPAKLELRVQDDGRGFSPAATGRRAGLGLRAMKYRTDLIGAVLLIDAAPGKGTRITCTLNNPS